MPSLDEISSISGRGPTFFWTIPFIKDSVWLEEISSVVLKKEMKIWKVYNDDDDNTVYENSDKRDIGRIFIWDKLTWAFGSTKLKRSHYAFPNYGSVLGPYICKILCPFMLATFYRKSANLTKKSKIYKEKFEIKKKVKCLYGPNTRPYRIYNSAK